MMKTYSLLMILLCLITTLSCSTESTPTYTLTITASPGEGGTISPNTGSFDEGETISLQATANEGWVFSGWQGDVVSTANPLNLSMTQNFTMIGSFEKRMHALTVDVEGQGTVTETILRQKTTDYVHGTIVELEAVPAENWIFRHWQGDLSSSDNPAQITVNEPKSIVGVFERPWPIDTETEVVDVTNPATGQTWMDRNLGASRAATSMTDEQAYGDHYQWGRAADGHENRNSGTTNVLSSTDQPGHGDFILAPNNPKDWRSPQNDELWQGINGINNPCPGGYRLPTEAEWNAELQSWSSNSAVGAFASPLKLLITRTRSNTTGSLINDPIGYYWSSTVNRHGARYLRITSSIAGIGTFLRAFGSSVRCLKD